MLAESLAIGRLITRPLQNELVAVEFGGDSLNRGTLQPDTRLAGCSKINKMVLSGHGSTPFCNFGQYYFRGRPATSPDGGRQQSIEEASCNTIPSKL